ncbi:hypothetical protein LOTGIDRAFT_159584 [Lottia gigantea]|uniref:Lysine-specific demethylase 3A/B tudor domain-containing protein n=1 Tax=Lottia gigantea TaxID=225164 RepID=V4AQ01_LOTGI|nr:hypothetical protein LOTGIDRAFT_159584 [Lottia gigantea]ESO96840.1 hypothetical protein LOTGIDRAFT_159584 [Lottia gigantea]
MPINFCVQLGKKHLKFVHHSALNILHQEGDEKRHKILDVYPDLKKEVKSWVDYQDGQRIILTTPTVLVGYRVEVYRAEGTTQWYTAVIQSYNHTSKCLAVTDDTVLEEHNEDPALIQMRLIDDGVVDSILRGVEVGIAPRRRPRKDNLPKEQPGCEGGKRMRTTGLDRSIIFEVFEIYFMADVERVWERQLPIDTYMIQEIY